MKMRLIVSCCIALLSAPSVAGDIEAGKAKSATCAACHGADGISTIPMYPNLAGQKELYMVKQMKAFRDGIRQDPIMTPMAKPLSDQDIADISAFYASLK